MKKKTEIGFLFFSLFAVFSGFSIGAAAPDDTFRRANAAFESGDFEEAISLYEGLVKDSYSAANLYLNLGTAHFRNGSPGKAALWFRRAVHINPGMPEVRQNFKFLRERQGHLEFGDGEWQQILLAFSPGSLRWLAWLCLWALLFSLIALMMGLNPRIKPLLIVGLLFSGLGLIVFFCLSHYRADKLAPENFATVVVSDTSALVAPAPDSSPVIALPEGSEVRILEDTGPWLYAAIPGDLVGWVHHSSIEKNWPIPVAK